MNLRESLLNVANLPCINFLCDRVLSQNYRGIQISEHNRYTVDLFITLLEEMKKLVNNNKMPIRHVDLSKKPETSPGEETYFKYAMNVKGILGRGTEDSIRKNLFVDMHRMGFIERYDIHGKPINPYEAKGVRSVSLTKLGNDLIDSKNNTFAKKILYTKAIDRLTQGLADRISDFMLENDLSKISIYDFMFFISFWKQSLNGHFYSMNKLVSFMLEYEKLNRSKKEAIVEIIKKYCDPKKFSGNKTAKRDFGNWKNEEQQIFMLLDQTAFFERGVGPQYREFLYLKSKKPDDLFYPSRIRRSKSEKDKYYKIHDIKKEDGFELHHIIPLLEARSLQEYDALDVWENMIYIDGYSHDTITQNGNKHVLINFKGDDILFTDVAKLLSPLLCKRNEDVKYNTAHQKVMKEFNTNTLNSLK